jgi:hypothetical protein
MKKVARSSAKVVRGWHINVGQRWKSNAGAPVPDEKLCSERVAANERSINTKEGPTQSKHQHERRTNKPSKHPQHTQQDSKQNQNNCKTKSNTTKFHTMNGVRE